MTNPTPKMAILYCRISDARNGDDAGVHDQEGDLRHRATQLGWGIGRVIVENDTSAFKRRMVTLPGGTKAMRVVRPGWRSMLADLAAGRADGLLALDLDRACRDPRDLEDLIDVVESRTPRVPVESVTGSLRLANDGDITMARVMVAVGNKSSRDTQRRVTRARLRQATEARYGGGRRPYGFEVDGVTIRESEAIEIRRAADNLLQGMSLRAMVADLRARNVPTVTGSPWTSQSLRDTLLRPRTAGLVIYQGGVVEKGAYANGDEWHGAPWAPIVDRDTWEAVRALLTDEGRRVTPGNTPRWLGSGLYVCGHPVHGDQVVTMRAGTAGGGAPAYRCKESAHLVRTAAPLDAFVERVIIARLSRDDAADLLVPRVDVDVKALSAKANGLRVRITEARTMWEDGETPTVEYRSSVGRMREQLAEVEAQRTSAMTHSPLADIAGRPDAGDVWARMEDLGRRRDVLDALMTVRLLPATRRGRGFDDATVEITWK